MTRGRSEADPDRGGEDKGIGLRGLDDLDRTGANRG
jgi:hypothetical protein